MTASPFNTPVGSSPTIHPNSNAIIANIPAPGAIEAGNSTNGVSSGYLDYSHPVYFAAPTDPLFALQQSGGSISNIPNGTQIRIPDLAQPANGDDHHLCVVEPDGTEYDFWNVTRKDSGGGTLVYEDGGSLSIAGTGICGPNAGAVAAEFGLLAGIIRPEELIAGEINHALFCTLPGTACSGLTDFGHGVVAKSGSFSSYVYPAAEGASSTSSAANLLPCGGLIWLDMTAGAIAALSCPAWAKAILTAMATYGMYFGDTSGNTALGLMFESGQSYTSFGIADPFMTYAATAPGDVTEYEGIYLFHIEEAISNWSSVLKILVPPSS